MSSDSVWGSAPSEGFTPPQERAPHPEQPAVAPQPVPVPQPVVAPQPVATPPATRAEQRAAQSYAPAATPTPAVTPQPTQAPQPVSPPQPVGGGFAPGVATVPAPEPVASGAAPGVATTAGPTEPTPPSQPGPLTTVKTGEIKRFSDAQLEAARVKFEHIIGVAAGMGVSDIHIVGDSPLRVQKSGSILTIDAIYVANEELLMFVEMYGKARGGAHELEHGRKGTVECMTQVGDVRLRMTFVREVHGYGCTSRIVPGDPPSIHGTVFEDNPIPERLVDITLNTRGGGLIIAEGPTGSGKTTLIAALLREVNDNLARHIYTIEDPIEFLHRSNKSLVTQREVGEHAESIPGALRTSLRYKPHIILVGELLDLETVKGAIEAANKGHLIFATSHASSAEEGVSALVNQFPGSEQKQIQVALSQALKAVVVQRLIPRIGGGLVPARELLLNTIPVALKIREGSFQQLSQAMKPTDNMFKFENDLARLIHEGLVDVEDAKQFANDRKELFSNVAMFVREHGMDPSILDKFTEEERGITR